MHAAIRLPLILLLLLRMTSFGAQAAVRTGAEVAAGDGFALFRGKKVGLVTNATAQVAGEHLLDLMQAAGTPPGVIFSPEHGLKGRAEDGVRIADAAEAGIPVLSLYGKSRKPRPEDLTDLDLLVFDIQDVGARFYTYISTMGLAMQAAAEAHLPFVVLDRPNPLGGDYVSGFVREDGLSAFTAQYPIPIAHGLTVGELARMIQGEAMLAGLAELDLRVVPMKGWTRSMRWPQTGLPWIPTSPNIPDAETALLYAGIGLLEATSASEGRGTRTPFKLLGAPSLDSAKLAEGLNSKALPGVRFIPAPFTPAAISGMSSHPKFQDREVAGVRIEVVDPKVLLPVETGVEVLATIFQALSEEEQKTFFRPGFELMAGSARLREALLLGRNGEEILELWRAEVERFRQVRAKYLLYE